MLIFPDLPQNAINQIDVEYCLSTFWDWRVTLPID
jgi:hypothetical protein